MKSYIILGVLSLICGSQAAAVTPFETPFIPAILSGISPRADVDLVAICAPTADFTGFGTRCADCFNMAICLGTQAPQTTPCGSDKKYCDKTKNLCVADKPTGDATCDAPPKTTFRCSAENGFFPHPTNCSRYFECVNGVAELHVCPPKYVWTTIGMGCKQKKLSSDCGTINCKPTDPVGKQVPLSNNGTFYGLCNITTTLDNILVLRCPGRYVNTGGSCDFVCTAEGLFVDDVDSTYYYECYKSGSMFLSYHLQCTDGRIFDEASQLCVAPPSPNTP